MGGGFGRGFRVGFGGFRGFGGVFAWVFDYPTGFGMGSVLYITALARLSLLPVL